MSHLPSGTVTFVFSDIEGSTRLLKRLGEGYGPVLAEHRRIVREAFGAHAGIEIDTQGDAFFFAFARARDAVAAAVRAQREHAEHPWPDGAEVRVRMGLHTGEPAVGAEGYLGLDVVRAARLAGSGRGGNVLLSETTRALLGSTLPDGVSVHALGERRLKDIDEPERIYELEIEGVEQPEAEPEAAPTTASAGATPPGVPVPPDVSAPPGAPAPPGPPSEQLDARVEAFSRRLSSRINQRVFEALERSLGDIERRR